MPSARVARTVAPQGVRRFANPYYRAHLLANKRYRGMRIAVCGEGRRKWEPVHYFARPEAFTHCAECEAGGWS